MNMKTITLKGISKRGKERVKQHGPTFHLLKHDKDKILVQSQEKTFSNMGRKEHWLGWFNQKEVEKQS